MDTSLGIVTSQNAVLFDRTTRIKFCSFSRLIAGCNPFRHVRFSVRVGGPHAQRVGFYGFAVGKMKYVGGRRPRLPLVLCAAYVLVRRDLPSIAAVPVRYEVVGRRSE